MGGSRHVKVEPCPESQTDPCPLLVNSMASRSPHVKIVGCCGVSEHQVSGRRSLTKRLRLHRLRTLAKVAELTRLEVEHL